MSVLRISESLPEAGKMECSVVLTGGGSQAGFQLAGIDQEAEPLKWSGSKTEMALSDHKRTPKVQAAQVSQRRSGKSTKLSTERRSQQDNTFSFSIN
jgi:hypothetical protein